VTEATPLLKFWDKTPNLVVVMGLPVILGFAAALVEAVREQGIARRRWFLVAAAIAIGFAAGMWQVRVFSSVTPIAMAPLVIAVVAVAHRVGASFSVFTRALLAGVLCIAVSPVGLASILPKPEQDANTATVVQATEESLCLKPAALEPLNHLEPARVAASVNLGPYLLAHTHHSVFAGPYHRDNHGNRIVVDAFLAPPDEAEQILRAAGAQVVLWCARDVSDFAPARAKRPWRGAGARRGSRMARASAGIQKTAPCFRRKTEAVITRRRSPGMARRRLTAETRNAQGHDVDRSPPLPAWRSKFCWGDGSRARRAQVPRAIRTRGRVAGARRE
jgi:hypothetical protein